MSVIFNGKLVKYHSPLKSVFFFVFFLIKLTIVEWLELIKLDKVLTDGKMTKSSLNEL